MAVGKVHVIEAIAVVVDGQVVLAINYKLSLIGREPPADRHAHHHMCNRSTLSMRDFN